MIVKGLTIYWLAMNILGYILMGYDKWRARNNKWRVAEKRFFIIALMGGSIGVWGGMQSFHHKTLHKKFRYGIPAIIFLQIALLIFLAVRTYMR